MLNLEWRVDLGNMPDDEPCIVLLDEEMHGSEIHVRTNRITIAG